ncbi:hypothetical protein [Streptomyces sp. NPDC058657]|uniref:hypothetical protein n=1 Tax=unclassified Streptomyces TaxID=2593676 RepID=UPI00365D049C
MIAVLVAALVLGAAAWAVAAKFNDQPVWVENVAYNAGYHHATQLRKTDRDGKAMAAALAGGCQKWSLTAGKKADDAREHWVRGCLDAAHNRASNPNEA